MISVSNLSFICIGTTQLHTNSNIRVNLLLSIYSCVCRLYTIVVEKSMRTKDNSNKLPALQGTACLAVTSWLTMHAVSANAKQCDKLERCSIHRRVLPTYARTCTYHSNYERSFVRSLCVREYRCRCRRFKMIMSRVICVRYVATIDRQLTTLLQWDFSPVVCFRRQCRLLRKYTYQLNLRVNIAS